MRNVIFTIVIAAMAACGSKPAKDTTATPVVTAPDQGSAAEGSGSDVVAAGSGSAVVAPEPEKPVEPPPPPEPDAFMKLSLEEKTKIMKTKVMPAMAKAFKAHDGKEFAKFTCKTCHGKGADDKTFKMPNPDLPPLDFAALKEGKQSPKMAEFMGKVVQPDMAKILGVQAYDEQHPNGFGCLTCHVVKK